MKLSREDIDFARDGVLYHLNEAVMQLYAHLDSVPIPEDSPPHRVKARYQFNAIGYILSDLKRHLHNDDLLEEEEDMEALDTNDVPPLKA